MSYHLQIFQCFDHESPEEGYLRVSPENSFPVEHSNPSVDMTELCKKLQNGFRLNCAETEFGSDLFDDQTGIQISILKNGQIFLSRSTWDEPVFSTYSTMEPYLSLIGENGRYWAYDSQLNVFIDLSKNLFEQIDQNKDESEFVYRLRFHSESRKLKESTFCAFFEKRDNYALDKHNLKAFYFNSNTDVNFVFEHKAPNKRNFLPSEKAVFEMKFLKASIFASEAQNELSEFTDNFDLLVTEDKYFYQANFDSELFLKSWYEENLFELRKRLFRKEKIDLTNIPADDILSSWRWNYSIDSYCQKPLSRIVLFKDQDKIKSAVCWKDQASITIPPVDSVLVQQNSSSECFLVDTREILADSIPKEINGIQCMDLSKKPDLPKCKYVGRLIHEPDSHIIPFSAVIEEEFFQAALHANSKSTRSCLAPPTHWE